MSSTDMVDRELTGKRFPWLRPEDPPLTPYDALGDLGAPRPDHEGGFRVTDPSQADWALRKLTQVREKAAEVRQIAKDQLQAIQAWQDAEMMRLVNDEEFFTGLLVRYHRERLAESPRDKTIRLPHGHLQARQRPDEWTVDAAQFLPWAEKHAPEMLRVKVEADKPALKKALKPQSEPDDPAVPAVTKDGEIVPGVFVGHGGVQFTAKTEVDQ